MYLFGVFLAFIAPFSFAFLARSLVQRKRNRKCRGGGTLAPRQRGLGGRGRDGGGWRAPAPRELRGTPGRRRAGALCPQVPELEKATVRIQQPERVRGIIRSIKERGRNKLQVISDFDMTLSRFGYNGRRCPTSHNILDNSRVISEDGKKKLKDLLHYYYPIEIDPNRTLEEKRPLMVEWWTRAHELLSQQKIQKGDIAQIVRESDVMLRDGFNELFDQLHKYNIPLFIFSAGVGDILEEVIRQANVFYSNVNVVSNYMDFDDNGVLTRFKGPLIHTYNKNNSVLQGTEYFQQLSTRTSIILLGDSMGDLTMADGVPSVENILKIGFLNDKVEERRGKYLDAYDIVLESDETLDVVNGILRYILIET
ncbi:7-methylguanosine phosphate-specific 5'-nucleotidase [Gavia stellata]|uniref:7-methylguanosine phosphate-specific 5'-nucleotidase n=1 Tax=Gavia stellata TaxID=37040 RepID=UPI00289F390A|nr:7-methylguanosine phosphate-specific 5'-nucleotidase [Gavia stellata]